MLTIQTALQSHQNADGNRPFTHGVSQIAPQKIGALALTYKGLINIKTPFDLALYARLIWELQPKTILELGSFQGGSALWFADHMSVLCEVPGEVHSFELHTRCIIKMQSIHFLPSIKLIFWM